MRPLTEAETKVSLSPSLSFPKTDSCAQTLFSKLANYIGSNLVHLVETPDDVSPSSIPLVRPTNFLFRSYDSRTSFDSIVRESTTSENPSCVKPSPSLAQTLSPSESAWENSRKLRNLDCTLLDWISLDDTPRTRYIFHTIVVASFLGC